MKNIIIILGITLCFVGSSCKEDFLSKTDPTKIDASLFYKNQTQMEQAVNGVYGNLQGIINSQWQYNELISDNTTIDYDPENRGQAAYMERFEYLTVTPYNTSDLYVSYYSAIYNINNTDRK